MTTSTAPHPSTTDDWRRLGRFLWVGRRDGRPIGTIEQGRWFVLTDEHGEAAGRYRSLADAQAVAADPEQRDVLQVGARRRVLVPRLAAIAVALGGGVALGTSALLALQQA